jgi:drug/metabolite transporter (DMT)-like permease
LKYYAAILITIILFSTVEVATKRIVFNIDPIYLAFLRYIISGVIIMGIGIKDIKLRKIKIKEFGGVVLTGIIGITVAIGLFHTSLLYIEAAKGAVIFSLNPVFSAIFAYVLLNEKLNKSTLVGMAVGFIGVYIVSFGFETIKFSSIKGPGLMLLSAVFFSCYIVLSKKYVKIYGKFTATGIIFISGAICYIPLIKSYKITEFSKTFPVVLYLAIFATGVAYICYFYGLSHISVAAGSSMFYLKPVIATILAVVYLKESLQIEFYIGVVVIFIGLGIALFYNKLKEKF